MLMELMDILFAYEEMGNRRFSKDTYEPSFEKFSEIAAGFADTLHAMYQENADVQMLCQTVSEAFVAYVKEHADPAVSRMEADEIQRGHNMFMATYVLPYILEMRNPYYKDLAKAIETHWGHSFRNSKIKAASFETVKSGFQKKFLGFSL